MTDGETASGPRAEYDVFMSYAHGDSARVKPIVEALQGSGLRVWFYQNDIPTWDGITRRIADGLEHSKALLAFYSNLYPSRRACQWELTAAFLSGQHEAAGRGPQPARVLVLNPEPHNTHLHPVELRDARYFAWPASPAEGDFASLAAQLKTAVAQLSGPLSAIRRVAPPRWYGRTPLGSERFVGRIEKMWELHSKLFANDAALITSQSAPGHAQVRGLGGMGKSLLAEEYALRFAAAYPGGIFFLEGTANRDDIWADLALARIAGLKRTTDVEPAVIERLLEDDLLKRKQPYLWLVDDLPPDLPEVERRRWFAPNGLGKTLITTRSRAYDGGIIDLEGLTPEQGYELLTARREPEGPEEEQAAKDIVAELDLPRPRDRCHRRGSPPPERPGNLPGVPEQASRAKLGGHPRCGGEPRARTPERP